MKLSAALAAHKTLEELTLIGYPKLVITAVAEGLRSSHTLRTLKLTTGQDSQHDGEDVLAKEASKAVASLLEQNFTLHNISLPVDMGRWVGRVLALKLKNNCGYKSLELTPSPRLSHAGCMDDRTGACLARALCTNTSLESLSLKFPANIGRQKGQAVGYNATALAVAAMLKANTTLTTLKLQLAPLSSYAEQTLLYALTNSATLNHLEAIKEFNGSSLLTRKTPFKTLAATVSVDSVASFVQRLERGPTHQRLNLGVFVTSQAKAETLAKAITSSSAIRGLQLGFRFNVDQKTVLPVMEALASNNHKIDTLRLDVWPTSDAQSLICEGIGRMIEQSTRLRSLSVRTSGKDEDLQQLVAALTKNQTLRSFNVESPTLVWPKSLIEMPQTRAALEKAMVCNVTCCSLQLGQWKQPQNKAPESVVQEQDDLDEDDSDIEEEQPLVEPDVGVNESEGPSAFEAVKHWLQRNRDLPLQAHAVAQFARQSPMPSVQRVVSAMSGPAGFSDAVLAFLYPGGATLHKHAVWQHLDEPSDSFEAQDLESEAEAEPEEEVPCKGQEDDKAYPLTGTVFDE